jgi:ABC-2 type transport system permease protein
MPIHDQGYRRYGGRREPRGRAWWVISRSGIMNMLRKRLFLAVMLAAWVPFVVRAIQAYVVSTMPQAGELLRLTSETFRSFLGLQGVIAFFVTVYVGAGLIANDRRANALQIYLSKPLSRVEYIAGKLVTLLVFLIAITWLPAMLLLVVQILFSGSTAFVRNNLFLFPAITLYSLMLVFVASFAILALSSMSKSSRFVGIMYAGLIMFSSAMYNVLRAMTGSSTWAMISPMDVMSRVADAIFRVRSEYTLPVPLAFLAVALIIGGSIWILERRVRGVEVVT